MDFVRKLNAAIEKNKSLLCVGLDPRTEVLPQEGSIEDRLASWGEEIIRQTADLVCCYKPNFAFFEQHGPDGLKALQRISTAIPDHIPVLLDVKRGDIGSTAQAYARAAFEQWGADAVTLNPYLGEDSVKPFLEYEGKTVFLLCHTSNPSSASVQHYGQSPLYEYIAQTAQNWGTAEQIAFVVGATHPEALDRVRAISPSNWILVPGVGAQGGDLEKTLAAGLRKDGKGLIVPVSRGVIMADDPREAAEKLRSQIYASCNSTSVDRPVTDPRAALVKELYATGCIKFGSFILASGKQSPIYIDLRRVVSFPGLFEMVVKAYVNLFKELKFDHVAGVPYAALPTGAVVAWKLGRSFIYPRKEAKQHGTGNLIEGVFQSGQTTVVLEDVITSGGSIVTSVDVLRDAGLKVKDVLVLVDREQGGGSKIAAAGLNLHAVMTISEILRILKKCELIDAQTFQSVSGYINENS